MQMTEKIKLFLFILKAAIYIAAEVICLICAVTRHDAFYAAVAVWFLVLIKTEVKEPEEDDESERSN